MGPLLIQIYQTTLAVLLPCIAGNGAANLTEHNHLLIPSCGFAASYLLASLTAAEELVANVIFEMAETGR